MNVEANIVIEMAKTIIYPAAVRSQGELADTAVKLKAAGLEPDTVILEKVTNLITAFLAGVSRVESSLLGTNGSLEGHAQHFASKRPRCRHAGAALAFAPHLGPLARQSLEELPNLRGVES